MDILVTDIWLIIIRRLRLRDLPSFSKVCVAFSQLISQLDWTTYFFSRLDPSLHDVYPKSIVNLSFIQMEGRYVIDVAEQYYRQWLKYANTLRKVNDLLCDSDGHIDIKKYEHQYITHNGYVAILFAYHHDVDCTALYQYNNYVQINFHRNHNGPPTQWVLVVENNKHKSSHKIPERTLMRTMMLLLLTYHVNKILFANSILSVDKEP